VIAPLWLAQRYSGPLLLVAVIAGVALVLVEIAALVDPHELSCAHIADKTFRVRRFPDHTVNRTAARFDYPSSIFPFYTFYF